VNPEFLDFDDVLEITLGVAAGSIGKDVVAKTLRDLADA
jgi:hypothetical protein